MPRKIYVTQYLSFSQGCLSIKCKWHIWYLCIPCYILIFSPMIPGTAMVNNFMQVSTLFAQTVSPFMHRQLFFHSLPGLLRGHSQENKRNTLWILSAQVMMFQKSDKHHGQHSSNGKQKLMHKCFPLLIRSWGGQFQKSFCTFLKRPWTIESPVPTIKSTKKYVPLWNFHLSPSMVSQISSLGSCGKYTVCTQGFDFSSAFRERGVQAKTNGYKCLFGIAQVCCS